VELNGFRFGCDKHAVRFTGGIGGRLLNDDQETIVRALERARRILNGRNANHRDAAQVVECLHSLLNEAELSRALNRLDRRRILRLVDQSPPA
jgi:hypothetical protein